LKDLQGAGAKRDSMLARRLHSNRRNGPHLCFEVDLIPPRAQRLTGARGCQDCELQTARGDRWSLPQAGHELGHGIDRHRRMMSAGELLPGRQDQLQVPAPRRGVLAGSEALHLGRV